MVDLFVRDVGEGAPLILLHGLFGSADNLGALIRGLSQSNRILAPDLRNHGRSPHLDQMDYATMAKDVIALMDRYGIERAPVIGHSMGGKVAMQVALTYPERVEKLVAIDIAPVKYSNHHSIILEGMQALAAQNPGDRKAAGALLATYVDDPAVHGFIMTNWRRGTSQDGSRDQWGWRLNLPVIVSQYDQITEGNDGPPYQGDILFIRGGASDYMKPRHRERILELFPKADMRTVDGAGHWLHAEKPDTVERLIRRFLEHE